jgi:N-acetylglucosamine transport system permease protein
MAAQKKLGDYKPTKGLPSGLSNWLVFALLLVWSIFSVLSLLWVAATSLRTDQSLFSSPWGMPTVAVPVSASGMEIDAATLGKMTPDEIAKAPTVERFRPQWGNYVIAWKIAKMGEYTANSIIVTCASVFFIVIVSAMAAYSITKSEFFGAKSLFYYFLGGLAVPASLLLVPLFMTLKDFNIRNLALFPVGGYWLIHIKDFYLIDSRLGLILIYTTLGIPFTVFVLTGFFRTLPTALAESAAVDGASEYTTFWRIYLPLAKPGLITVAIFNFLFVWNEYQFALVFISNERLKTLPVGLYSLMLATQHSSNWTALFAGLVILMLPTLAIFIILEDRITKGLTMGAIKS